MAEPTPKCKGAPRGNQNRFEHGLYSKQLQATKRRRLRGRSKRLALETLTAVLADQGNPDDLSATFQFVCQRFSKRVGRLAMMEKAVEGILKSHPQISQNPSSLAKLFSFLQPLEDGAINDAKTIGFIKATRVLTVNDRIAQLEAQRQEKEASHD